MKRQIYLTSNMSSSRLEKYEQLIFDSSQYWRKQIHSKKEIWNVDGDDISSEGYNYALPDHIVQLHCFFISIRWRMYCTAFGISDAKRQLVYNWYKELYSIWEGLIVKIEDMNNELTDKEMSLLQANHHFNWYCERFASLQPGGKKYLRTITLWFLITKFLKGRHFIKIEE